jgi:hypothetical protein
MQPSDSSDQLFGFKSDTARRAFDSLVDSFIEDYMVKKYVAEKSGWRTIAEIAQKARLSPSTLYGKHSTLGPVLNEPIRRGLVESRVFPGERGRGGEVMRLRITYDKEPIRELVNKKIMGGRKTTIKTQEFEAKSNGVPSLDPFEQKIADVISESSLFSKLEKSKISEIVKLSEKFSFSPNEFIVHEGDIASGFFLIVDGQVEVQQRGKSLSRIGKGRFFGETTLAENESRCADIIAIQPTTCVKITASQLRELIKIEPQIAVKLLEEMVKRNRATNRG